ncbi:MAG: hypothetical protein RLY87_2329 [Chloroflexota bacterium]
MPQRAFFYKETNGFRVTVHPVFLVAESDQQIGRFVFSYTVRIENCSRITAQLRTRDWTITDSIGEEYHVSGDGVVGQQPILRPSDVHEYRSFCVLKSGHGTMVGFYTFHDGDSASFVVAVPEFILAVPDAPLH